MPPKRTKIDYKVLKELCQIHCTGEECAAILGIDYDTLNRRIEQDGKGCFTDYFKKHSSGGKASLRRRQFQAADDGSIPMMIWLGKQHLGQLESPPPEKDDSETFDVTLTVRKKVE